MTTKRKHCAGTGWVENATTGEATSRRVLCRKCGRYVGVRWVQRTVQCYRVYVQPHKPSDER